MERQTHIQDVDELVELLDDLVEHPVRPGDDDGEEGLVLVEPHGKRLDVVAPPGEHPGDTVYHAALVPDEHGDRVAPHPAIPSRRPIPIEISGGSNPTQRGKPGADRRPH